MLFGPPPEGSTPDQPQQPAEQTCANCGAPVDPTHRFCTNCGAPIAVRGLFCTNCGTALESGFRYCTNCGADITHLTGVAYQAAPGSYPVQFEVQYPEKLSRLLIFVKLILAIPQYLVVYALSSVISVVTFISFFAILFTGRYPRGLFNLVVGFTRWGANVSAYTSFFRDEYPPFSMDPGRYPVTYEVEYPERLSRWYIFFKWLLVIPNQIALLFLTIASAFLTFLAWWAILFTGRFPRGFFNFNVGVLRWGYRATAYANLLRDEYPPYSKRADAKPSGAKAIAIGAVVGVLALAAIIGGVVALATIDPQTETVIVDYERLEAGSAQQPIQVEGTRVTLSGVEDPYLNDVVEHISSNPRGPEPGSRFVAFDMTIVNVDSLFTSVSKSAFRLEDSFGDEHEPIARVPPFSSGTELEDGEQADLVVIFEIDELADPISLTYSPGVAAYLPFGERVRFEFR